MERTRRGPRWREREGDRDGENKEGTEMERTRSRASPAPVSAPCRSPLLGPPAGARASPSQAALLLGAPAGGRKRMDIEQLPVRDRYILSCEGPHHGQGLPTPGKTQGVNPPLQDPAALGQSPGNWGNCLLPETWGSPGHLPCRWKS
ncbi:odorant-binding protein 2b isoform X1 [Saccopteryx bilineata]|uniref:odorant-binding protein 2b isoform X1 n=1 Tax=Saccopteryx bilineata TaxID=59482 RepID=UPI00338F4AFF